MHDTRRIPLPTPRHEWHQSRVTKGKELLPGIDGRSRWARRLYDIIANHVAEMGGAAHVTQSQYVLIRSAANLTVCLERWEVDFAKQDASDEGVSMRDLIGYQTVLNSLRRVYETLGLERKELDAKDITPTYDETKLTPPERKRWGTILQAYSLFGVEGMSTDQLKDFNYLSAKMTGWGNGPSNTDAAHKRRPFKEIAWERY